jgi:sterol desaturase/sphingolipid hydroxylase (fatty acid hydroxylase superfamily)
VSSWCRCHPRYVFPIIGSEARFHDFHHTCNQDAFGRSPVWDIAFGTLDVYRKHVAMYPTLEPYQQAVAAKRA